MKFKQMNEIDMIELKEYKIRVKNCKMPVVKLSITFAYNIYSIYQ